jgi:hypothetical protein
MPERIQRKRTKGWRMPDGAIYVGRPSQWGNPYITGPGVAKMLWLPEGTVLTVEQTVACYADMVRGGGPNINGDKWLVSQVGVIRHQLRGHDLACWCPLDQPCHADVLLELANG